MASAHPDLAKILHDAGFPTEACEYLLAKGIRHTGVLANMAADTGELYTKLGEPLANGWTHQGTTHVLRTMEKDVWLACLQVAWEERRALRTQQLAASQTPTPPAAPTITTTTPRPRSSKPPTTLAPQVWHSQIKKWEDSFTPSRRFPQELLVGAEAVLARLLFESQVSRLFTPIRIGEVLQLRSFTSTGQVNPLAAKTADKHLGLDGGKLTELRPDIWDPRSLWSVVDGLEAIKWCFIFADYGDETTADRWTQHFIRLARTRQHHLPAVKACWDAASWRVALDMRKGESFAVATATVLADAGWFQDCLGNHNPDRTTPATTRHRTRSRTDTAPDRTRRPQVHNRQEQYRSTRHDLGRNGKGRTRGADNNKGRGKGQERSHLAKDLEVCRNFNEGRCHNTNCSRTHTCSKCKKPGHGAHECRTSE